MNGLIRLMLVMLLCSATFSAEQYKILFKGKVYIDGTVAPIGTEVKVGNKNGVTEGYMKQAASVESYGKYAIFAFGEDDDDGTDLPGFNLGDTVYFFVNGKMATMECGDQIKYPSGGCNIYINPPNPFLPPKEVEIDLSVTSDPPQKPDSCTFQGSVILDGQSAPYNTKITVKSSDQSQEYASTYTSTSGVYQIKVYGDDPETSAKDGPANGEQLTFFVNDKLAQTSGGNANFLKDGNVGLNLTAGESPVDVLCTFKGIMCYNEAGNNLPVGTSVKAYNQAGNVCGQTITTEEGGFTLPVNKESGEGDGAVNGEEIEIKFNDVATIFTDKLTNQSLVCVEGNNNIFVSLQAYDQFCKVSGVVFVGSTPTASVPVYASTASGVICGADTTVTGGVFSMIVKGDISGTVEVEGLAEGEQIYFRSGKDSSIFASSTVPSTIEWSKGQQINNVYIVFPQEVSVDEKTGLNKKFQLFPCQPNPFNPSTKISFYLPEGRNIDLSIYNIMGEKINTLKAGHLNSGKHEFIWNGKDSDGRTSPAGLYFIRLKGGSQTKIIKASLIK